MGSRPTGLPGTLPPAGADDRYEPEPWPRGRGASTWNRVMNRLKEYLEEPEEQKRCGDYWVIYTRSFVVYVTPETAAKVARRIEGWRTPRWVTFLDIVGARVRVRGRDIDAICESTELQRERDRSFQRARLKEDEVERRSWEDND